MKNSLLAAALLAVPALAAATAASAAEGISYNQVQAGYIATNGDGNADADGWAIDGSVAVHPNFHLFGGFNRQEIDDTSIDVDQWRAGVGYNHEVSPRTDLLTRVAYEKFDAGDGLDFDGWSVEAGARAALTQSLEGYALAGYENYDSDGLLEDDSNFYGRLGAHWKFNQNWGLSGDVKFSDGNTQWFVGPRLTW
ncbi:MAG TPA: diffusible signal factor-reguated Ax21 family protein [Luteimonas sp.]|nr:diffusible signal factor-reguated Ax21 family protein [Luteimonas sp.]